MKKLTKSQAIRLIKSVDTHNTNWTCRTEKNGLGDYGYTSTYFFQGKPIVRLVVSYNPPKATAYDVRTPA